MNGVYCFHSRYLSGETSHSGTQSLYRKRARTPCPHIALLSMRASDTALGLLARNDFRLARHSGSIPRCFRRARVAERSYLESAKPLNLMIVLIVTRRAHRVPRDEIRHVPTQRVAKVAGSTEMDAAEDPSVSDF